MANYHAPGVYVEELETGPRPIERVGMTTAGFVGIAPKADARVGEAVRIGRFDDVSGGSGESFRSVFVQDAKHSTPLAQAVHGFFANGGTVCYVVNLGDEGPISGNGRGLDQFAAIEEIAMLAAPGRTDMDSYDRLLGAVDPPAMPGGRIAILDAPPRVDDILELTRVAEAEAEPREGAAPAAAGEAPPARPAAKRGRRPRTSPSGFGALYFPWLRITDPIEGRLMDAPPSGAMAGICARTDELRGVHKAPANVPVIGALGLTQTISATDQASLNLAGVNCIRRFGADGVLVWGARTLARETSDWRYLNVRRLFLMIERSILRSTRWVVFEPNDRPLWKAIRRDVEAFLTLLWREGALMGATREQAFFVRCDEQTNTPEVIAAGQVVTVIGLAPVKPAEFVVFRIGQSVASTTVEQV